MFPVLLYLSDPKSLIAHGTCEVWVIGNVVHCQLTTAFITNFCYKRFSLRVNNRVKILMTASFVGLKLLGRFCTTILGWILRLKWMGFIPLVHRWVGTSLRCNPWSTQMWEILRHLLAVYHLHEEEVVENHWEILWEELDLVSVDVVEAVGRLTGQEQDQHQPNDSN